MEGILYLPACSESTVVTISYAVRQFRETGCHLLHCQCSSEPQPVVWPVQRENILACVLVHLCYSAREVNAAYGQIDIEYCKCCTSWVFLLIVQCLSCLIPTNWCLKRLSFVQIYDRHIRLDGFGKHSRNAKMNLHSS